MKSRIVILSMVLLLAGCAGTGPSRDADDGAAADRGPLDTEKSVRHEVDNRAVAMLWDQAEEARRQNRTGDAIEALERALRVAPEDPVLWSRLAEMRFRQRDFAVAENLAAKSNALAGDRRLLRYRNWVLIAEARRQRGDEEGAREAREKAEGLRSGRADGEAGRPDGDIPAVAVRDQAAPPVATGAAVQSAEALAERVELAAFEVDRQAALGAGFELPPGYELITPDGDRPEPATPDRAMAAEPGLPSAGGWAVQAGSFTRIATATELRDRLDAAGFPVFIREARIGERRFHRVRVGPAETRSAAVELAERVRERLDQEAIVVRDRAAVVSTRENAGQ
ncbi:MAG: SPOR domain-containing protein [Halofilum sp. (in: g-proteobacteria)]|nr:SPOR domain-containing protein [Halofilum sp. (in: g-proteobacteria)]